MKYTRMVGLAVAAAALAIPTTASAQPLQPPANVVQYATKASVLGPRADGWLTGAVTTSRGGKTGRTVYVFDRHNDNVARVFTGATAGHSAGYYQVKVSTRGAPFSVYVDDWLNSWQRWDLLPAVGMAPGASAPVVFGPSHITILPQKGDGWFSGKVTDANGAGQAQRTVVLFNSTQRFGTNVTGTTSGHSAGYWQIRTTGYAGISLTQFNAYVMNRLWPALRSDNLPKMSAAIPYNVR